MDTKGFIAVMIKKLCAFAVSILMLASASYVNLHAASFQQQNGIDAATAAELGLGLRIGLVSRGNRNSIGIESRVLDVGFYSHGSFRREATLHGYCTLAAVQVPASYVRIAGSVMSFENARNIALNHIGERRAVPVLVSPENWAVYIGPYPTLAEAEAGARWWGGAVVPPNPARIAITDGGYPIVIFDNMMATAQFTCQSGITSIDSGRYRGVIEPFVRNGVLTAVNIVNIEDYLLSVVPSEMPATWHIEALKAQAVAARTYALARLDTRLADGFHLCDTVQTQVYRGVYMEHENSTRAVNETRGIMAFHNGFLIDAVYFSSSGGHTKDSENVWSNVVPYLRGVRDTFETEYMRWSRYFTMQQLTGLMAQNGHNIGEVTAVTYRTASNSGRMIELTFVGTNGNATYRNNNIRSAFRHSTGGNLESTNFIINSNSPSIVINGRGWGHGVGMSQFGARGMAEAGFTFKQILKHYYTDIEVR